MVTLNLTEEEATQLLMALDYLEDTGEWNGSDADPGTVRRKLEAAYPAENRG